MLLNHLHDVINMSYLRFCDSVKRHFLATFTHGFLKDSELPSNLRFLGLVGKCLDIFKSCYNSNFLHLSWKGGIRNNDQINYVIIHII